MSVHVVFTCAAPGCELEECCYPGVQEASDGEISLDSYFDMPDGWSYYQHDTFVCPEHENLPGAFPPTPVPVDGAAT